MPLIKAITPVINVSKAEQLLLCCDRRSVEPPHCNTFHPLGTRIIHFIINLVNMIVNIIKID